MSPGSKHISPESFPYLVDCNFAVLVSASWIEPVAGVNYDHFLVHLQAETLKNIQESIRVIEATYFDCYFKQVECRILEISDSISTFLKSKEKQISQQALLFSQMLKNLEAQLNVLKESQSIILLSVPGPERETQQKLHLNCTAAFLGTFLRISVERQIIISSNISALLRWVSMIVITSRKINPGLSSLRNAFNSPRIEVLEQLLRELEQWVICIKDLIEKLSR
jgi:hypothetical protein